MGRNRYRISHHDVPAVRHDRISTTYHDNSQRRLTRMIFSLLTLPLVATAISAFSQRSRERLVEYVALAAALGESMIAFMIAASVLSGVKPTASYLFEADALGAFVLLF